MEYGYSILMAIFSAVLLLYAGLIVLILAAIFFIWLGTKLMKDVE